MANKMDMNGFTLKLCDIIAGSLTVGGQGPVTEEKVFGILQELTANVTGNRSYDLQMTKADTDALYRAALERGLAIIDGKAGA